jgi:hypothetical protein
MKVNSKRQRDFNVGDLVMVNNHGSLDGPNIGAVGIIYDLGMSTAWVLMKDGKEHQVFISCLQLVTEED